MMMHGRAGPGEGLVAGRLIREALFDHNATIGQKLEGSIYRGERHMIVSIAHERTKALGGEVSLEIHHGTQDGSTFVGTSALVNAEIFVEFLFRRSHVTLFLH